jgi:predicted anti-sigma-YlaC factor YlaD
MEAQDLEKSAALRARARRLYLRARDYGLRGLDVRHHGFSQALRNDSKQTVRMAKASDVPLLYWTAASWGLAISLSKDNPDLIADQPIVEDLIDRAYALDPDFDSGAIHGFLISYELARQGIRGDPVVRAKQHFDREVTLTDGQLASPFVSFAEAVSVPNQDRAGFEALINRALAVDADARPEWRLENLVMQRRARWLLSREADLFIK